MSLNGSGREDSMQHVLAESCTPTPQGFHMELLKTIRRVLANLRDHQDLAAARIDVGSEPSPAYLERMDAVARTDRYIDSLSDVIPVAHRQSLHQCVAHLQHPVLDVPTLGQHVRDHEAALHATIHRGGMAPSPSEAEHLERLTEVRHLLEQLASERD
jgi:hypothetical protein